MKPIQLTLRASPIFATLLLVATLLLSGACLFLPWAGWARLLAGLSVLGVGAYSIWKDALLMPQQACRHIRIDEKQRFWLKLGHGQEVPCTLSRETVVTPICTMMVLQAEHPRRVLGARKHRVYIWVDNVEAELFRQLRVALLRFKAGEPSAPA